MTDVESDRNFWKAEPSDVDASCSPIIIKHEPNQSHDSASSIIREHPPDQLLISKEPKIITIEGENKVPKRKLVIEKLPQIPEQPAAITVERWLSYPKIRQKVVFNRSPQPDMIDPKNYIIEWEIPEVQIKNELKYLGIVEADPLEYEKTYGSTLKYCNDLPQFAREIKAPDGFKLASECDKEDLIELYGDIHALKLIDLEKEGLNEYRKIIEKIDTSFESSELTNVSELESISF